MTGQKELHGVCVLRCQGNWRGEKVVHLVDAAVKVGVVEEAVESVEARLAQGYAEEDFAGYSQRRRVGWGDGVWRRAQQRGE